MSQAKHKPVTREEMDPGIIRELKELRRKKSEGVPHNKRTTEEGIQTTLESRIARE